jgi:rhamnogalacturonan endolyase
MRLFFFTVALSAIIHVVQGKGPFLQTINAAQHVIGNDLWNITIGPIYGTKLYYQGRDCVGRAVGHYVSYSKKVHPDKMAPVQQF